MTPDRSSACTMLTHRTATTEYPACRSAVRNLQSTAWRRYSCLCNCMNLQALEVNRWYTKVVPVPWVAGKQQYLMPAGRIEQDAFHVFQAVAVTVHQSVVQDDQRWPSCFPQQIGVGQAADQSHLFPGTKTQFGDLPQFAAPAEGTG